jgi:hypothetical protein
MRTAIPLLIVLAAAWAQDLMPPANPPGKPVEQPIPFAHKTHVAQGIKCLDCHTIKAPGDQAGFPAVSTCMGCHASIKKESPAIQKLADYAAKQTPVPWARVYKLPRQVYFSHEVHHRKAKVECAVCHGPVAEREALVQEKSITMKDCMTCHDQRKASNDCALCHDSF